MTVLILLVFLMTRVNPVRQKAMPYDFGITGRVAAQKCKRAFVAAARTFADTALVLLSGARIARYAKCCH